MSGYYFLILFSGSFHLLSSWLSDYISLLYGIVQVCSLLAIVIFIRFSEATISAGLLPVKFIVSPFYFWDPLVNLLQAVILFSTHMSPWLPKTTSNHLLVFSNEQKDDLTGFTFFLGVFPLVNVSVAADLRDASSVQSLSFLTELPSPSPLPMDRSYFLTLLNCSSFFFFLARIGYWAL